MLLRLCSLGVLLYLAPPVMSEDAAVKSNGTFSITLNRQKTPFEQHLKYAHILKEYGINVDWMYKKHPKMGGARTNDSVALYRAFDYEFYGTIVIGHPGQILNVAFDTAWALSWVMSSSCHTFTDIGCLFHNKYDHSKSSEYKPDGRTIVVPEGKYNLSGFFSFDNISFAHSNVTNFLFAEMTSLPYTFLFSKIDGVLGLGLQNNDAYVPFFYALLNQKKIASPIFCIYLNRDKQSDHGGNIIMGFIEKRHIHHKKDENNNTIYDEIRYMPIKSGYYWTFDLDTVYVNMVNVPQEPPFTFCSGEGCTAITDTSSNNIYGPKDAIEKIHNAIKAKPFFLNRYTIKCDTINKLPEIAFTIGGQNFTLKGRDYTIKLSYLSPITLCLSAFVPHERDNFWVLGGAFLSEYYTIYNVQDKKIGIVKAA